MAVPNHYFVPVAFEISGVIDPQSRLFLKELDHCIKLITGEASSRSTVFLLQCLSVAGQRGNAASVLGSISRTEDLVLMEFWCLLFSCFFSIITIYFSVSIIL